ncbi:MAG: hypothetical protein HN833_02860 [Elusimicrobiaceae bacterium]|jgi:hypothetical protein|nr:hypothetical protein [Elusimicrobiaceae bacterium]MBT3954580.1 hypothetical protein [Elusimicrobiaceae bacterium]MBT4007888.1 hypothetical protein [Elusimicrobiaceae bacterium]MBT4402574.1 hypothetical protein [Elusimicrobiaceae bacterium]MBT4439902.1 hypothetical protein [Elusimicrobiaceae bacterium]
MLKIKKFKIATHSKEILRKVIHGKIDIAEAGFASNSDVQDFAQELADKLDNGVVYQTFEKEDIAFDGIDLENNEIFSGAIITLGKDIETELEKLTNDKQIVIANIAIMEFLKTSFNFVFELIKSQAKKDNFEILQNIMLYYPQFNYIREPKFFQTALKPDSEVSKNTILKMSDILKPEKISAKFIDTSFTPKYCTAFISPWVKKSKKRK